MPPYETNVRVYETRRAIESDAVELELNKQRPLDWLIVVTRYDDAHAARNVALRAEGFQSIFAYSRAKRNGQVQEAVLARIQPYVDACTAAYQTRKAYIRARLYRWLDVDNDSMRDLLAVVLP